MKLLESAEMYLETIYRLSKKNAVVRSIDVADYMGYSKPSVSRAVSNLKKSGHLVMNADGALLLTQEGKVAAQKIYERHSVLTEFLQGLGVPAEVASEDACKMEHVVSDDTIEAIKRYVNKK